MRSDQPRRTRSLEVFTSGSQPSQALPSPSRTRRGRISSPQLSPISPRPLVARNTPPTTPASSLRQTRTPVAPPRILFYHKHHPHYGFTNFSPHPVMYEGKRYPTSEHLFQSFKFQRHQPGLAEHIRTCSEWPSMAFSEARRFQPEVRPDWKVVNLEKMDETLWHKFTQHHDLREELLSTGNAELVEDSDKDAFWGVGADGSGCNELGDFP
ncbi:hypothetical protein BC835DRAFT_954760 [Cytidiella melzeri]|nr:hypothetical protein BC835DRAFT_954760 [Cytidiella melzeri]